MTLVDTNILLDIATRDPAWAVWSLRALEAASAHGPLVINGVIYAELSVRYEEIEDLDDFLLLTETKFVDMPKSAFFAAAKVYARYRSSGGTRTSMLPDFFIGAHAGVLDIPLLTRDTRRYRTYFPTIELIAPQPDEH